LKRRRRLRRHTDPEASGSLPQAAYGRSGAGTGDINPAGCTDGGSQLLPRQVMDGRQPPEHVR